MESASQAYTKLLASLREMALLGSVASVLGWDERTMMPPKGAEHRANQMSLLARMVHEQFTSPRIGELLSQVESSDLVSDKESDVAVNVRETRRAYDRATKLPAELVEEITRTGVLSQNAWGEARKRSEYPLFEPWLAKMLDLKRREAELVGYEKNPYDALLDEYEPGETAERLAKVFESLRGPLVELVGKILDSGKKAPVEILERNYPAAGQELLSREAAARIGFDFEAGRLDTTIHPFCSGLGPGDTRLTTRYDGHFFGDAFFGVLHEAGHGLYDQGLDPKHFGTPLAEAISLGIHESQSRFWENFVGRSRAFWQWYLPRTRQVFPAALEGVSADQWYFAVNAVRPTFIRTESDETTYNLHILLRFELEQALISGQLTVHDAPGAWNERMKKYLGITPPNDAQGILQDIHWSDGGFGYFPTYTLGNLYAAQFFEAAHRAIPDLDDQIARGEFGALLGWLRANIHRHGMRYRAHDLVKRVTGAELSAEPLLRHLRAKASELYGV